MPKKTKSKLSHTEIMKRFEAAHDYFSEDYQTNKEDQEFALGTQWPEQIRAEREAEGRPCLTENRLLPFVNQVVNSIRQARPSVMVKPVDSGADEEIAEILGGMIRNIQNVNEAETVYDTAAYNAVSAGYGWIRIGTRYADYDSFDQEITMDRIINPFSVIIDPNSIKIDASDAEFMFVFQDMGRDEFEHMYPDADPVDFEAKDPQRDWGDDETVRVAEYWYKDYEVKKLCEYEFLNPVSGQFEQATNYKDDIPFKEGDEGFEIIREREVKICNIKWCKLSGAGILDEGDFVGSYIPIVPVLGLETWFENKRRVFTLINQAKDPQRMFNYWKTASTEIIALQPKAPWTIADSQLKGYESTWANANRINHAVLPYKPATIDGMIVPPPQRNQPPTSSGSMMQEAMAAAEGIKSSLGMFDERFGQSDGDVSGKAIIARQLQGDNSTFHFVDNLASAMRQVGRILIDMIPQVYNGQQFVRILGEDGEQQLIPINQPVIKEKGEYRPANPDDRNEDIQNLMLDIGKYDVVVEVGNSYATRRQELANTLVELARVNPEILSVAGDLLVSNLDFPDADMIAKRIRSQMSPELLAEDAEDARVQQLTNALNEMQATLEQTELALQMKENDQKTKNELEFRKVELKAQEVRNDTLQTIAEIRKIEAETEQKIPAEAANDMSQAVERLQGQLDDVVGAVEAILDDAEKGQKGNKDSKEGMAVTEVTVEKK